YHHNFKIIPKTSTVTGYVFAEAFIHEEGYMLTKDYEGMGVKVYAKDKNGKVFEGTVDNNAQFEINDLPVTEDDYTFYIEVPGHLTTTFTLNPAYEEDGTWFGDEV